jgi:ELP3 family radical SAM enzyme/protein acetyltransferase
MNILKDLEDLHESTVEKFKLSEDLKILKDFKEVIIKTDEDFRKFILFIQRKYKKNLSKREVINIYNQLNLDDPILKSIITKKNVRSHSGVVVITVFTSAYPIYGESNESRKNDTFSCKWNCHFCPNEKPNERNNFIQQPRSYLFTEPGVLRANACNFDCINQMNSRMNTLLMNGHIIDKLEILVLGGTWCSYPKEYQYEFIRDIYYSANIFMKEKRIKKSLEEEIKINENTEVHIIGLTLETRPDTINMNEIIIFRNYGCTRVQLGIQHTNNEILKKINRGHSIETSIKAIKLLKDNAFKVDIHLMPNLPGSSVEKDLEMFKKILYESDYQADQWKIYPCAVTPYTKIKEWYENGEYVPYEEEKLYNLIKYVKQSVPIYIRLNRIIRDISSEDVIAGYSATHMRQILQHDMKKNNWYCKCIRCREIKNLNLELHSLKIEKYNASKGIEYFISLNTENMVDGQSKLIGFLRLRICEKNCEQIKELKNCGLVRELHIYGKVKKVGNKSDTFTQHKGYGKMLLKKAEELTKSHNLNKIAIISGIGVRNYYEKNGYMLENTYMIKKLTKNYILLHGIIFISIILKNVKGYIF